MIMNALKMEYNRYLNPASHHPVRITKADKDFAETFDFKDIDFPVKVRDICKIESKNSIAISFFGYENQEKYPIYVSKKCYDKKNVDLLFKGEGEKNPVFLSMTSID